MANSITTAVARMKMAKARAGETPLPPVTHMAFGTGGVDQNGDPLAPSGADETLRNEVLRKPIDGYIFPWSTAVRYSCALAKEELEGIAINEVAIIDSDGDPVAFKTFRNKIKDGDMEMIFEIDDEF